MRRLVTIMLQCLFVLGLEAQNQQAVELYIERYSPIAIAEMMRTNVPASIKLAQGILESGAGTTDLALNANNHFGIKCSNDWTGPGYSKKDDDFKDGVLVESCFRVYTSPEESYRAHTDFLLGRKRYAYLFEYERTDYKRWAKGLKSAGYATDPGYPQKLIQRIEEFQLFKFDTMAPDSVGEKSDVVLLDENVAPRCRQLSDIFTTYKKGLFAANQVVFVYAKEGDAPLNIAIRQGIPLKKILKFNDLRPNDEFYEFQPVFIAPKKSEYKGTETSHQVIGYESMYEISQKYGIKLENLLEINGYQFGQEPAKGSQVWLVKQKKLVKAAFRQGDNKRPCPTIVPKPIVETAISKVEFYDPVLEDELPALPPSPEPVKPALPDRTPYRPKTNGKLVNTSVDDDGIVWADDNTVPAIPDFKPRIETEEDVPFIVPPKQEILPAKPNVSEVETPVVPPKQPDVTPPSAFKPILSDGPVKPTPSVVKTNTTTATSVTPVPVSIRPGTESIINQRPSFHIVQKGDTPYNISRRYNIKVADLVSLNGIVNNSISLGQKLNIPQN